MGSSAPLEPMRGVGLVDSSIIAELFSKSERKAVRVKLKKSNVKPLKPASGKEGDAVGMSSTRS